MLGDPRVNQNPALLALGIIFYRWHNVQAAIVQAQHPDWIDEDVFQAARRRVIATMQVRLLASIFISISSCFLRSKNSMK